MTPLALLHRYECPLRDGMFAPRSNTFPSAWGDFEAASVVESFLARVPWFQMGVDHFSLSYFKDGNEQSRKILLLDMLNVGVVKHRQDPSSEMPTPKFEVGFKHQCPLIGVKSTALISLPGILFRCMYPRVRLAYPTAFLLT